MECDLSVNDLRSSVFFEHLNYSVLTEFIEHKKEWKQLLHLLRYENEPVNTKLLYNIFNLKNNKALKVSCKNGLTNMVKVLIKYLDPSLQNNRPILIASKNGHLEIVKLLLADKRVDPLVASNYLIKEAARNGNTELFKLLLTHPKVDPTIENNYVLRWVSFRGYIEILKLLLSDPRIDPGTGNNFPFYIACENGHLEIVKLLIKNPRVNPSDINNSAIRASCVNGHIEIVKLLLEDPRVDPSLENNIALLMARTNEHDDIVDILIHDERVDWRILTQSYPSFLTEKENIIKKRLTDIYLILNRLNPKTLINGKLFNLLNREIIKKICYLSVFYEIYKKRTSEIPQIELCSFLNVLLWQNRPSKILRYGSVKAEHLKEYDDITNRELLNEVLLKI